MLWQLLLLLKERKIRLRQQLKKLHKMLMVKSQKLMFSLDKTLDLIQMVWLLLLLHREKRIRLSKKLKKPL